MEERNTEIGRHDFTERNVLPRRAQGGGRGSLILASVLVCSHALAERLERPAEPVQVLPDVVVTARKRPESEQAVPGSMSVRTADQLAGAGTADLRDAAAGIPNLTLGTFAARRLTYPYVRGIGSGQNAPGVTTYIDGVPQLSNVTANQELLGVERIEFLRGPQGALYGSDSLGGVIHVVPRMPSYHPDRNVRISAGSHGFHAGDLSVAGPIGDSGVLLRLDGGYAAREGYTRNRVTGRDLDSREAWAGRVQFYLPVQGDWDFRLSLTTQRDRDGGYALYDLDSIRSTPHRASHDFEGYNHRDLAQPVFTARRHGEKTDFVSITAWQWWQTRDRTDLDYTPADLVRKDASEDARAWIQEWRLSSPVEDPVVLGDRLTMNWLAGIFAFHQESTRRDLTDYRPGGVPLGLWSAPFRMQRDARREDAGAGLFGHAAITLDERWEMGLGLRYDYQHRTAETSSRIPPGPPISASNPSRDFNQVSPSATLGYRVTPAMLVYADVAKGYRAGGFNAIAPPDRSSYDEEVSVNVEVGLKSTWLDERLSANAALFHTDWEDIQVNAFLPGGSPSDYYVANGGRAWSRGAEIELRANPWRPLELFAGAGLLDTRYRSGSQSADGDVSGNELPFAPRFIWQAGFDYGYSLGHRGRAFLRSDVTGTSRYYYDASNRESQSSHARVNLRLGLETGPWRTEFWVRNLFDRETVPLAIPYGQDAQGHRVYIGESGAPRTMGISLARAF